MRDYHRNLVVDFFKDMLLMWLIFVFIGVTAFAAYHVARSYEDNTPPEQSVAQWKAQYEQLAEENQLLRDSVAMVEAACVAKCNLLRCAP